MKKKFLALALAGAMTLSLTACGGGNGGNASTGGNGGGNASTGSSAASGGVNFPTKSITMIIPYDAGGGSDLINRRACSIVEQQTGWSFTCTNMPGGSGATGYTELLNRDNDGYTLLGCTSTIVSMKQMGILDIDHNDFDVVAGFNQEICVLVANTNWAEKNNINTLSDFIDYSKANPGSIAIGTSAVGGIWNLDLLNAASKTGCEWNVVPNAGGGARAVIDCAGGSVQACAAGAFEVFGQVEAGSVKVLGVMTDERLPFYPDAETFQEAGFDVIGATTRSILAPKGTNPEILTVLEKAFMDATSSQEFIDFCENQGTSPWSVSGQEAFETYNMEMDIYASVA